MPSVQSLQSFLHAEPQDPFLLYALAIQHAKEGDLEQAVDYHDRCVGVDPEYLYAYYHKARALEALGRIQDAMASLTLGQSHARRVKDSKALAEICGYLGALKRRTGAGWKAATTSTPRSTSRARTPAGARTKATTSASRR